MGAVFNLGAQDGYSGPEKLLEFPGIPTYMKLPGRRGTL